MARSQFLFTKEHLAGRPAWFVRQLAGLLAPPAPPLPPRAISTQAAPRKPAKAKGTGKARVPRTHNAGTMTEAQFWQAVRSGLRRTFRFWKPALAALKAARIAKQGPRGQKWAYLCADCRGLFLRKQVQIDHVTPCGSLRSFAEVGPFLERLCAESADAYAVRCRQCHQNKTNAERS